MRNCVIAVCAVLMLFVAAVVADVEAAEYLGDYCWNYTTDGSSSAGIIRIGIFWLGGDHYTVSGLITATSPQLFQTLIHGNAEAVGDQVWATLIDTYSTSTSMTTEVMDWTLDLFTLDGIYRGKWEDVDSSDVESNGFFSGALTYTICP